MAEAKLPRLVNTEALIQYENSSFNVNARRALYDKYAVPEVGLLDPSSPEKGNWGMELEIIRALQKLGYDSAGRLADIGCGDARFDERLIASGHTGEIWPINYPSTLFYPAQETLKDNSNVHFLESRAEDLILPDGTKIPDGYFNVVCLNHLLYHLQDYEAAIKEARRILAPGGLLVVSTKQEGNQGKLWSLAQNQIKEALEGVSVVDRMALEQDIAKLREEIEAVKGESKHLSLEQRGLLFSLHSRLGRKYQERGDAELLLSGITPPTSFYEHFDFEIEKQVMPEHGFTHTGEEFRQFGKLRVPNTGEGWLDVKMALFSFKDMYSFPFDKYPGAYVPIHASTMMRAIDIGAKPLFDKETSRKTKPYFEVDVMMGFDIWQKAEDTSLANAA